MDLKNLSRHLGMGAFALGLMSAAPKAQAQAEWLLEKLTGQKSSETLHQERVAQERINRANKMAVDAEACRISQEQTDVLGAAEAVYQLPPPEDLDDENVAQKMPSYVASLAKYNRHVPAGYKAKMMVADPISGLKAVLYESPPAPPTPPGQRAIPRAPYILAFAGTESSVDAKADLGQGAVQYTRLLESKFLERVQALVLKDNVRLHLTGHSLGGGLAQYALHKLLKNSKPADQSRYHLTTFNAFGVEEILVARGDFNKLLIRSAVAENRIQNYFIDGDLVAKIGVHLGPTFVLPPVDKFSAHSLDSFHTHMGNAKFCLMQANPDRPKGPLVDATKDAVRAASDALKPAGEGVMALAKFKTRDENAIEGDESGFNYYFTSRLDEAKDQLARSKDLLAKSKAANAQVDLQMLFESSAEFLESTVKELNRVRTPK